MHRPLRVCLPSKEREEYVLFVRKKGCTLVTERQKNRYIDKFLRYCSKEFGHTAARKISKSDLIKYGKHVDQTNRNYGTSSTKLSMVFQWFHWLAKTNRIPNDPANGLKASQLIATAKSPVKSFVWQV